MTLRMKLAVCWLGLAVTAAAQTPAPLVPEIRGRVLEPGTLQAIGDAEVLVFKALAQGTIMTGSTFSRDQALERAITDASGAFHFAMGGFGSYRVKVEKEGYGDVAPLLRGSTANADVTLSREHPAAEVHFWLGRSGEMTGRVVDGETGKPLAGVTVGVRQMSYVRAARRGLLRSLTVTDAEGRFVAKELSPSEYLAVVRPNLSGKGRLLKEFTPAEREAVDQDFEETYWPGGHGEEIASPLTVGSGASMNVGMIAARKVPRYRVRFSFAAGTCDPGEEINVGEIIRQGFITNAMNLGTVPCGKEFLVRNYAPGMYSLSAWAGRGESKRRGVVDFLVKDKNLDETVALARGVDVEGRIVAAEGAGKPPLQGISILMSAIGRVPDQMPAQPDEAGAFRLVNIQMAAQRLSIAGIGAGYCVKEIRYNGARLTDEYALPLDPHAMAHSVEIVVDDKPAAISGAVTDSDKPVAQPYVVLVRWPVDSLDLFLSVKTVAGSEDGKFRFGGLAAGEYRLLAMAGAAKDKLEEPHVLERLLVSAQKVTVGTGGFQNVNLTPADPLR